MSQSHLEVAMPRLPRQSDEWSRNPQTEDEAMFGNLLDERSAEASTSEPPTLTGITVTLRDMRKHKTARTPKTVPWQEAVQKLDRVASLSNDLISGASRVIRVQLTIRFGGGRVEIHEMTDVGRPDAQQAENYISTVALHSLSFPAGGFRQ